MSVIRLALLAVVATLAGCGTVPIAPTFEERPLFRPIEARVGVAYTGAARTTTATATGLVRFEVGKTSVARFGQVFDAMFAETVPLPDWPPWREGVRDLDGVVELERVDATISLGDGDRRADAILVTYRICLYGAKLSPVGCWTPSWQYTHQRTGLACFDLGACMQVEVEEAIRQTIARFMLEFERDPAVLAWARGRAAVTPRPAPADAGRARLGLVMWPTGGGAAARASLREIEVCITQSIAALAPGIVLVHERSVRDALFPLLEPATEPSDDAAFAALLVRQDVRERLEARGLDYLVALAGKTSTDPWKGPLLCGAGYGGGGCLGFMWQGETTDLHAALWSVSAARPLAHETASATGVGIMPAFVLPVPLLARTRAEACRDLAARIVLAVGGTAKR